MAGSGPSGAQGQAPQMESQQLPVGADAVLTGLLIRLEHMDAQVVAKKPLPLLPPCAQKVVNPSLYAPVAKASLPKASRHAVLCTSSLPASTDGVSLLPR
jgi:hypothetical protein